MELLDNDPKSTQNGTKWFCMLINDPMSVLPNELANLDTNSNVGSYNFLKVSKLAVYISSNVPKTLP